MHQNSSLEPIICKYVYCVALQGLFHLPTITAQLHCHLKQHTVQLNGDQGSSLPVCNKAQLRYGWDISDSKKWQLPKYTTFVIEQMCTLQEPFGSQSNSGLSLNHIVWKLMEGCCRWCTV